MFFDRVTIRQYRPVFFGSFGPDELVELLDVNPIDKLRTDRQGPASQEAHDDRRDPESLQDAGSVGLGIGQSTEESSPLFSFRHRKSASQNSL